MKSCIYSVLSFFLSLKYSTKVFALKGVQEGLIPLGKEDGSLIINSLLKYKDEMEAQMNLLKKNENLPNEVDSQLKELYDQIKIVRETQLEQKSTLLNFSKSLEQTKLSFFKMLGEYENRINQLEYTIMDIKKYDPFIEKFMYPISKYWLKIDFANVKSLWKYEKKKKGNYISLNQEEDITSLKTPATILLLRYHKLMEGYIHIDMLQISSSANQAKQSTAGVVFHFLNPQNFRLVELSFINEEAFCSVGEVSNSMYKRILSRRVNAQSGVFNSLTCEFTATKMDIFLNYKKVMEVNLTHIYTNNTVGLFTKMGRAEFINILSGNIHFEKALKQKLMDSRDADVLRGNLLDSYRFSKKIARDDLSVYEMPYAHGDYDSWFGEHMDNVYPVPDSNSYHEMDEKKRDVSYNVHDSHITGKEQYDRLCNSYHMNTTHFNISDWDENNNTLSKWRVINEYGIIRIVFNDSYKNIHSKSWLVYKYSSCNSVSVAAYLKLENETKAGLLFRYDNGDNMYILTISTSRKEVVLKRYENGTEIILMSRYAKNINSFQRHHVLIDDVGEKGTIHVFLDSEELLSLNNAPYYKSGMIGLYIEHGYASFDTLKIGPIKG
ncbi:conserved Plasmodium protein, unknown function [Plasmodium ovale curtisi]|uniref:Uncharacterized protein n=1 Tax=Plasmodium ovale curtisi TaxID=864141 RepID=A0A1A8X1J8_PLAOA|nr:conserved Plasmodium protein, unknown function [Plasmodium ovale curtisi]